MKGKNVPIREYWGKDFGYDCIKRCMHIKRFEQIRSVLRFDITNFRNRKDKLSPIRDVFDSFIAKCKANYFPTSNTVIDESLVSFRGRCSSECIFLQNLDDMELRFGR